NVVQTCIDSPWRGPYVAEYVKAIYCGGFKINGGGELNHDYCPSNFEISGEHYECVTDQGIVCSTVPLVIRNSTVFQPPPGNQNEGSSSRAGMTAAIFLQGYSGSVQRVTEEKNFIAGGAYALTGAEEEELAPLTGPITVSDNRFARCLGAAGRVKTRMAGFPWAAFLASLFTSITASRGEPATFGTTISKISPSRR